MFLQSTINTFNFQSLKGQFQLIGSVYNDQIATRGTNCRDPRLRLIIGT